MRLTHSTHCDKADIFEDHLSKGIDFSQPLGCVEDFQPRQLPQGVEICGDAFSQIASGDSRLVKRDTQGVHF